MSVEAKTPGQLLKDLIAIPSVNPSFDGTGEARIADFVEAFLANAGLQPQRQTVFPDGRDNVFATIGDRTGPAVLLEAHLDTVATEGWLTGSPFEPVEKGGRIFGRGACDTKGSLAVFLTVAAYFAKHPDRLATPLVFAATIDEEDLQTGAFRLMEAGLEFRGAITGEPTLLDIIHAHKGVLRFQVESEGIAAHSAFPEKGENAISKMSSVVSRLDEYARDLKNRLEHPTLGCGTVNIGVIRGGQAVNVVPDSCTIDVDRRLLPDETGETVLAEIRELLSDLDGIKVKEPLLNRLGIDTPKDSPFAIGLADAVRREKGQCEFLSAPYMTNATAYAAAGIPSLVFGPGNITDAHRPDESIEVEQLESAVRILIDFLATPIPSA
ncbi:MAG TPA: M20 family metallopeptidase [Opitutales bacterium]|nr:M20 family metallopeptidase [Opitutales bacterium]